MNLNRNQNKYQVKSKKTPYKPVKNPIGVKLSKRVSTFKVEFNPLDYPNQLIRKANHFYSFSTPEPTGSIDEVLSSFDGAAKRRARELIDFLIWGQITYSVKGRKKSLIQRYNYSIRISQYYLAKKLNCTREWINELVGRLVKLGFLAKYRTHYKDKNLKGVCFYKVSLFFFKKSNIYLLSKMFPALKILLVRHGFGKKFTLIELYKELLYKLFNIKLDKIQKEDDLDKNIVNNFISSENKEKLLNSTVSLSKIMSLKYRGNYEYSKNTGVKHANSLKM